MAFPPLLPLGQALLLWSCFGRLFRTPRYARLLPRCQPWTFPLPHTLLLTASRVLPPLCVHASRTALLFCHSIFGLSLFPYPPHAVSLGFSFSRLLVGSCPFGPPPFPLRCRGGPSFVLFLLVSAVFIYCFISASMSCPPPSSCTADDARAFVSFATSLMNQFSSLSLCSPRPFPARAFDKLPRFRWPSCLLSLLATPGLYFGFAGRLFLLPHLVCFCFWICSCPFLMFGHLVLPPFSPLILYGRFLAVLPTSRSGPVTHPSNSVPQTLLVCRPPFVPLFSHRALPLPSRRLHAIFSPFFAAFASPSLGPLCPSSPFYFEASSADLPFPSSCYPRWRPLSSLLPFLFGLFLALRVTMTHIFPTPVSWPPLCCHRPVLVYLGRFCAVSVGISFLSLLVNFYLPSR